MQIDIYMCLAAVLLGLGIGGALSHRNIMAIIACVVTAGVSILLAMTSLVGGGANGVLFALCLASTLIMAVVLGSAVAYRRFKSSGTANINENTHLKN